MRHQPGSGHPSPRASRSDRLDPGRSSRHPGDAAVGELATNALPTVAAELTLAEAVPLAHVVVDQVAHDHDVRVLFIKGPIASAQGLRPPRVSLDVDALVDPARRSILATALADLGWVDDHPYTSPTVLHQHSLTHRHPSWPCELDLHDRFPGFFGDPQHVFETLWSARTAERIAGRELLGPGRAGQSLILALHSLRDPHDQSKGRELTDLVERVAHTSRPADLRELAELAAALGAADTAQPFLEALGAPSIGAGSSTREDLQAWRLRTNPDDPTAVSWVNAMSRLPIRRWPSFLWYAATLSEKELRLAYPSMPPGRLPMLRARARRLRRGLAALPAAYRSVRESSKS